MTEPLRYRELDARICLQLGYRWGIWKRSIFHKGLILIAPDPLNDNDFTYIEEDIENIPRNWEWDFMCDYYSIIADKAFNLPYKPGIIWTFTESEDHLCISAIDRQTKYEEELTFSEFKDRAMAYATGRCLVWLKIMETNNDRATSTNPSI